jgi:hypothetical protein
MYLNIARLIYLRYSPFIPNFEAIIPRPMKKIKIGLLPKIIIAIALGVGAGYVFPDWLTRVFATFNGVFSQFLGFIIPLIITIVVIVAAAVVIVIILTKKGKKY